MTTAKAPPILEVEDLCIDYLSDTGPLRAVDSVSFTVGANESLGLAGESGCGKSTLVKALMRLLEPPGAITGGEVRFEGRDLLAMDLPELHRVRWKRMAFVFQSAMHALNPVLTIGEQIADVFIAHEGMTPKAALEQAELSLTEVGIESSRLRSYPHELSGGMRQRVVIAIALALRPKLLIMDEPTTALDVVVQRELLQQIDSLRQQHGFSILFITHDIGLMLEMCDRIGILYAGRLVELAGNHQLHADARHPYTEGLMNACPSIYDAHLELRGIPGTPPPLRNPPAGCRFQPRCARGRNEARCRQEHPQLVQLDNGHAVACHLHP